MGARDLQRKRVGQISALKGNLHVCVDGERHDVQVGFSSLGFRISMFFFINTVRMYCHRSSSGNYLTVLPSLQPQLQLPSLYERGWISNCISQGEKDGIERYIYSGLFMQLSIEVSSDSCIPPETQAHVHQISKSQK